MDLLNIESVEFEFRHYSKKEFTLYREWEYQGSHANNKPNGFWLSKGDVWANHAFDFAPFYHAARVTLEPTAKILVLKGETTQDWNSLKREGYDGVYLPHPNPDEYYGWDVASACIWNLKAVKSVDWIPNAKTSQDYQDEQDEWEDDWRVRDDMLWRLGERGFHLHDSFVNWVLNEMEITA